MATGHQSPTRIVFGPYEVNAQAGELRKNGSVIRLSGQPLQILLALLKNSGHVVTREQLRQEVWGEDTFVDFEHGLNAAVNKLRGALNDSAEKPRYVETVPGSGYRFIGAVEHPSPEAVLPIFLNGKAIPPTGVTEEPSGRSWRRFIPVLAAVLATSVACLAISGFLWWRLRTPAPPPPAKLVRLTTDPGLSETPAMSLDGKQVAYSSDRGTEEGRDLFVRNIAGGQPLRLTFDGAGNTTPDFSPDGSRIVFRSSRDGGGIYEMSVLGGAARLIVRGGLDPRYSPDASRIAYWVGAESVDPAIPGSGAVWVIPGLEGQPKRVAPNLTAARFPIWSRDGKRLLVVGYDSPRPYDTSRVDWWLVPVDGGNAVRTGGREALRDAGLSLAANPSIPRSKIPRPGCWSMSGDEVAFPIVAGATRNLWRIELSPVTGRVTGPPRRLTTGTANEVSPSCSSGGAVTFANIENRSDFWFLKPSDAPQRSSDGPAWRDTASISQNGGFVAFGSDQSGFRNIWLRDLASGKESLLAPSPISQGYPVINASGTRVAYSVYEGEKRAVYVSAPGGVPEKLCDVCLRATDWSGDEKSLLVFGGSPYTVGVLDIASHRQTTLISSPGHPVLYGRFSPDYRWISFTHRVPPSTGRITIAPLDGPTPIPETAWITIADAGPDDYAMWSSDGGTLFFTSSKDGFACLWGQRIDARSHRPVGDVFSIRHFHGRAQFEHGGWSAAADRIAIPLVETAGSIWMIAPPGLR